MTIISAHFCPPNPYFWATLSRGQRRPPDVRNSLYMSAKSSVFFWTGVERSDAGCWIVEGIPPAAIGTPSQTHKKIIFVWEPGFGFGNVQTIYLDKLAQLRERHVKSSLDISSKNSSSSEILVTKNFLGPNISQT